MSAVTVGAFVVIFKNGRKSTYRWMKTQTYYNLAKPEFERAQRHAQHITSVERIHKSSLHARMTMSPDEFKDAFGFTPAEVDALLHMTFTIMMPLWKIEQHGSSPVLRSTPGLQLDFSTVKSIKYAKVRTV
jgi:hypothetical protein